MKKIHSSFLTASSPLTTSTTVFTLFLLFSSTLRPLFATTPCRTSCGNIPIHYPLGIDYGCGAPQFQNMLNCSTTNTNSTIYTTPENSLFFLTPSGSYKVQHIDYKQQTMVIYDPLMSTCSILQPHHDFKLTDIQSVIIPPSPDTVFALMNCSIDSPILNHYSNLCFTFSNNHSCTDLYSSCNAFRVFRLLTNTSPPCCFTMYDTVRYMSMNILDCSHYTSFVINSGDESLMNSGPLDWTYGIKLSYSVADSGCQRCSLSGGTCGFDTDTGISLCLCSDSTNATRQCGPHTITAPGFRTKQSPSPLWMLLLCLVALNFSNN